MELPDKNREIENKFISEEYLYQLLSKKCLDKEINGIIFVDGENVISQLEMFIHQIDLFINNKVHLVICVSRSRYYRILSKVQKMNNISSYLKSKTHIKNAVDLALTFYSATLNMLLPINIVFYFLSSDNFVNEVKLHFIKRKCIHLNPQKLEFLPLPLPLSEEDIHKQKIKLEKRDLLDENKLREIYFNHWHSTQNEFCNIYKINQPNFSKWLRSKKSDGGVIKRAIITWINSLE